MHDSFAERAGRREFRRRDGARHLCTAANAVVIIGSLVTVSDAAINADEPGVLRYTGEFVLAKAPGAIDSGQIVHAKADGKIYGTASAGAIPCGYALESAESDAPYIRILLIPTGQPSA